MISLLRKRGRGAKWQQLNNLQMSQNEYWTFLIKSCPFSDESTVNLYNQFFLGSQDMTNATFNLPALIYTLSHSLFLYMYVPNHFGVEKVVQLITKAMKEHRLKKLLLMFFYFGFLKRAIITPLNSHY